MIKKVNIASLPILLILFAAHLHLIDCQALKVPNDFPPEIDMCFLSERKPYYSTLKTGCVATCKLEVNCLLVCQIGTICRLYSATVSPHWVGGASVDANLVGAKCYSLWAETKDIAGSSNIFTTNAAKFGDPINLLGASDGYGCGPILLQAQFYTDTLTNPWLRADLGSLRRVDRVVIKTRSHDVHPPLFGNAEVRVGNTSVEGNFGSYALLDSYPGEAVGGEIVTLRASSPILGRYVSVQLLGSNRALLIVEMKIIEA